jgi:hypothetical protein
MLICRVCKGCVDGARERVVLWSYINRHVPYIDTAAITFIVPYPTGERVCNGSLGAQYTRTNNVLLYLEGSFKVHTIHYLR